MSFYWYLPLKESEFWELSSISFSLHKKAMVWGFCSLKCSMHLNFNLYILESQKGEEKGFRE